MDGFFFFFFSASTTVAGTELDPSDLAMAEA
jgi:hypothetical protein